MTAFFRRALSLAGMMLLGATMLGLGACRNTAEDAVADATAMTSPQAFLQELYDHYDGKGPGAGIDYSVKAELDRYFTPDTVALIDDDRVRAALADEVPALNGDPFVGSQEWDVTGLDIAVGKSAQPEQTMAIVRYQSYGETHEVRLDLRRIDGAWKIADITWGGETLRGILVP